MGLGFAPFYHGLDFFGRLRAWEFTIPRYYQPNKLSGCIWISFGASEASCTVQNTFCIDEQLSVMFLIVQYSGQVSSLVSKWNVRQTLCLIFVDWYPEGTAALMNITPKIMAALNPKMLSESKNPDIFRCNNNFLRLFHFCH